jgi:hypothetical protein
MNDSTNTQAPDLGPGAPVYPPLAQLVRVTGPALGGTSPRVYPCAVSQFVPPLSLRDREPAYVFEPNGQALFPGGYYDCRLVGAYNALPLYATVCCPAGGSSSSAAPH